MIKDIKLQLKNGINEKEIKAISFILFLVFSIPIFVEYSKIYNYPFINSFMDYFIFRNTSYFYVVEPFYVFMPIISMTLFSFSKWKNKKNGMDDLMLTRMGKKRYYLSLFWANFISAFTVILIFSLFNLICVRIAFPYEGTDSLYANTAYNLIDKYRPEMSFENFRMISNELYLFAKITFTSFAFGTISNFAYVLSFSKILKKINFIILVFGVFLSLFILAFISEMIDINYLNYINYFRVDEIISTWLIITVFLLIFIVEFLFLNFRLKSYENID